MGRALPTECPHRVIVDWGDFGPTCPLALEADEEYTEYCLDPDNCTSCYPECPSCAKKQEKQRLDREHLRRRAVEEAMSGNYWAQKVVDLLEGRLDPL